VLVQGVIVNQETFQILVAIAAAIITLSFIVQAVVFLKLYGVMKKMQEQAANLQKKVEPVIAKVEPVVQQVQATVVGVKATIEKINIQAKETFDKVALESRAIAAAVSTSSQEISALARHQAEQISSTLDLTTTTLQRQVMEMDGLLTRTQQRIDYTTVEVQSSVLEPVRELTALLAGLRRSVEVLFGGRRKPIDRSYQDDEMFIG